MSLPFDLGDASLVLQVVIFSSNIGASFAKKWHQKEFYDYGSLTILALIFHLILIFVAMIPSLGVGLGGFVELPFLCAIIFWSHVTLGTVAEILVYMVVGFWISKPISNLAV